MDHMGRPDWSGFAEGPAAPSCLGAGNPLGVAQMVSWGGLEVSGGVLRSGLGRVLGCLGGTLGRLGRPWSYLGSVLGSLGRILAGFWDHLGGILGDFGGLCSHLGRVLGALGGVRGGFWKLLRGEKLMTAETAKT